MTSADRQDRIELLKKRALIVRSELKSHETPEKLVEYHEILTEIERIQRIEAGFQSIMTFAMTYFRGEPPHDLLKADTPSPPFHHKLCAHLRESVLDPMMRRTAIAAPRSHAKCLSGDSIIYTRNGRKRLVDINVGDEVLSMGDDLKMTFSRVSRKWESGTKDVYLVKTKSGHELLSTLDHKYYTMDGYKRLGDLSVGDNVAITRTLRNESSDIHPVHEVRFLAYMIAEGSLSSGNCIFTNADDVIVHDFIQCTERMGFKVNKGPRYEHKIVGGGRQYFREQGLYGHKATTKRVPSWVFDLSPELKCEFLSAIWDTDGYISQQSGIIGITLCNDALIDDIRELLLSIGIQSRKIFHLSGYGGKPFPAWALQISDRENIIRFHEKVHLLLKQDRLDVLASKAEKRFPHPTNDGIPESWHRHLVKTNHFYRKEYGIRVDNHYKTSREKLQRLVSHGHESKFLADLASSDIFWDEIESIDYVAPKPTYDIEVEGTHNFVANAFIVHNSTIVTNIFPLWCVCYADDVNERYWVIIGDKQDNARKFLDVIKDELEDNQALIADFGRLKGDTWNALEIVTANKVKISAHGAQEGLRGLRYGSFRPSVIMDDIESDDSCSTADRIEKMVSWFDRTVLPLGDPKHSKYYLVGTVIHYNSLLSQVMNKRAGDSRSGGWEVFKYRAIEQWPNRMDLWNEWEGIYHSRLEGDDAVEAAQIAHSKAYDFYESHQSEMVEGAKVLWPERMDLLSLMTNRATKRLAFNSEYLNDPIDEETRIFHTIHYYKPLDVNLDECQFFGACDPSMGQTKRSDPSAIVTMARDKRGILYVVDVDVKRRHPDEIIQAIFRKARQFNYSGFLIEATAFQQFMRDEVIRRSSEIGLYIPVKEFKSTVKKELRIASIEPFVTNGQIRFLPTQRDLLEEMEYFPKAAHDDSVDCLAMCFEIAKTAGSRGVYGAIGTSKPIPKIAYR